MNKKDDLNDLHQRSSYELGMALEQMLNGKPAAEVMRMERHHPDGSYEVIEQTIINRFI
jgi:hypothetical protein